MWQPLSRIFEFLGRIRVRADLFFGHHDVTVGDPTADDAQRSQLWHRFTRPEKLYDVWGPHPESQWTPFHAIPIFAALDRIPKEKIGPTPPSQVAPAADRGPAPQWVAPDVLTIIDLPGPASVEAAAWLVTGSGCQPVCTFNNWPHPKGLIRSELILAELLRWATTISDARERLTPSSPPLWICDSARLGQRSGKPGEFDNRYYIEEAALPGPGMMKSAGINLIVYVTNDPAQAPVIDLDGFFFDSEAAGIAVHIANVPEPGLPLRPWITKPPRKYDSNFKRSSAGGFGSRVPEPSSGGGG
jgi:hypothetical protein